MRTTSFLRFSQPSKRGLAWLLGVLVIGIIGMHGLAACRTVAAGSDGGHLMAVPAAAVTIAHAHSGGVTVAELGSASTVLPAGSPDDQPAPRELVGACVAALLGLAGLVLLMLPARRAAAWSVTAARCRSAMLVATSRALGPPSLGRWAILRC